jgi:Trypsin
MIVNYHIHDGEPHVSSCSVTLIDTNLVVTARHCVADPTDLEVRSGCGTMTGASVTSVSNFDYAGGSSGSALFDSMGRLLGAALSAGGPGPFQCNVGYCPASAVLTVLANPPEAACPSPAPPAQVGPR